MTDHIILNGPDRAGPMLNDIASILNGTGLTTQVHLGSVDRLLDTDPWRKMAILVSASGACTGAQLKNAASLRAIVSPVLGIEQIDVAGAQARGVLVVRGEARHNSESMAEATVMFLLCMFLDLRGAMLALTTGGLTSQPERRRLGGKTIGIIGHGTVAKAVIRRLRDWDVRFLVHRRSRKEPLEHGCDADLPDLLRESDALVVLCSLTEETREMIGAAELALLKPGAYVVNTARGGIIDEDALCKAASAGRLGGVALDVFANEPLPSSSPLLKIGNAILTPHIIGHTVESGREIRELAAHNVVELLAGSVPNGVVNDAIVDAWRKRWSPAEADAVVSGESAAHG